MLKKLFQYSDLKTMLRINALSVVITLFCEIFVVFVFLNKATLPRSFESKICNLPYWINCCFAFLYSICCPFGLFHGRNEKTKEEEQLKMGFGNIFF
jgi:hypothetical protein